MVRNIPVPQRDFTKTPRLTVIRSFDINKPGCQVEDLQGGIAGGSILHGVFKVGDEVEIRPGLTSKEQSPRGLVWKARPLKTKIVSLSSEQNKLQYAVPGGLIGVGTNLDPCLCRGDNLVGNIIGYPGTLPEVFDMVEITFHLMNRIAGAASGAKKKDLKIERLSKRESLQVNIGSCCTTAEVKAVEEDVAKLILDKPICCQIQEKVALSRRIDRHWRLIGWGNITKGHSVEFME